MKGVCRLSERDYLLTDWRKYSILVESEYERKNEMLDYLRTIRFEIRANNVYLKDEHRPKSYDDIYKLIPYKDLGKKEKKKRYVKPSQTLIESAKRYGINIVG